MRLRAENKRVQRLRQRCLVTEEGEGLEKSTYDYKKYRIVELDNRLQAVLVHDPYVAFSAAALTVKGMWYQNDGIKMVVSE